MRAAAYSFPSALALFSLALAPTLAIAQDREDIQFPERDTIELGAETERAFDRSGEAHVDRALPGGAVLSDHAGAMQNVTVARLGPDGNIETLCTDSREEALNFLAGIDRGGAGAARSVSSTESIR